MFEFAYGKYHPIIRWPLTVFSAILVFFLVVAACILSFAHDTIVELLKHLPDPMEP